MKNSLALITAISFLVACSSDGIDAKKADLEKLKQQESELKEKIAEKEIMKEIETSQVKENADFEACPICLNKKGTMYLGCCKLLYCC